MPPDRIHRVTFCEARRDYVLWLHFEDGLRGQVFLGNLLGIGAFKIWRDVEEFMKVSVDPECATVTWEGGIRLDPEVLYLDIVAKNAHARERMSKDVQFRRFMASVVEKPPAVRKKHRRRR